MIYLVVYITDDCDTCNRVVSSAKKISNHFQNVELTIKNIKEAQMKVSIVPAVFVNKNLFCYGDINNQKLIEHISHALD